MRKSQWHIPHRPHSCDRWQKCATTTTSSLFTTTHSSTLLGTRSCLGYCFRSLARSLPQLALVTFIPCAVPLSHPSIHPSIHSTLNTFFPSILTSSYPPPLLQKKRAVQEYPPYHQTTLSPRLHETPQNLITILLQLILAPITLLFLFWLSLATHSFIQIFSHHKLRATLVRLILRVSESVPSSSFFQFSDITLSLE